MIEQVDLLAQVIKNSPKKITRITSSSSTFLKARPFIGGTTLPPKEDLYALLIATEPQSGEIFNKIKSKSSHVNPALAGFY